MDAKTKQLIYLAMKVITNDTNAINFHVPMAKAAGATRDEVKSTILLTLTINGLKSISKYLGPALEIYDNC